MINWLKFHKLISLECLYQKYVVYIKTKVPLDTSFKNYVECHEAAGWRIL